MVAALLQRFAASGRNLHVVTRGRGGGLARPHRVDMQRDTYREVGDEAMVLAALAFAGIGRPGRFFATLRDLGARVTGSVAFADRCAYPPAVLRRLLRRARAAGAMLVTTEKDAVRLPPGFLSEVVVVQVHLEPVDWAQLDHFFAANEFGLPHSQQADAMFSGHKRVVPQ
jgi:tetraacyldisaccharide 4'-kinase